MLIEFSVENFRSIKEKQTFSMLSAAKVKEHPENVVDWDGNMNLTKSAIIYGRNASGKSNLLKALLTLSEFVSQSSYTRVGETLSSYDPFRLDKECKSKPTTFEIYFIASDNIRYQYQVQFTSETVLMESLFYYPKKQRAKLFVRERGKPIDFSVSLKGDKKSIEKQLLSNQLFLSKGANSNIDQFREPYSFLNQFVVSINFHDIMFDTDLINTLSENINAEEGSNFRLNIENLLRKADTGISSIYTKRRLAEKIKLPEQVPKGLWGRLNQEDFEVKTVHKSLSNKAKGDDVDFDLQDESSGTIRLFVVGGWILKALRSGWLIIIDELDKSLHPLLTKTLIKLFHNPKTNPKNAQLIFATHDISLMDNELFRRDQIWFTEKESDGATKLYSLSDFKGIRKENPYDKWYMSGRFGAIPSINAEELNLEF